MTEDDDDRPRRAFRYSRDPEARGRKVRMAPFMLERATRDRVVALAKANGVSIAYIMNILLRVGVMPTTTVATTRTPANEDDPPPCQTPISKP